MATPQTEKNICDLHLQDKSSYEISKITGVSATQVRRIINNHGLKARSIIV